VETTFRTQHTPEVEQPYYNTLPQQLARNCLDDWIIHATSKRRIGMSKDRCGIRNVALVERGVVDATVYQQPVVD